MSLAMGFLDRLEQYLFIHGLLQEGDRAAMERGAASLRVFKGGEEDDGERFTAVHHPFLQFQAVEAWHPHVQYHHRLWRNRVEIQKFPRRGKELHLKAG